VIPEDRLRYLIEREEICTCEHPWAVHVNQGNGYEVCLVCATYTYPCILELPWRWGIHPDDYAKVKDQPGPDAYHHVAPQ
jgi:hypothetical protein